MAFFTRLDLEHVLRQIMMAEDNQLPLSPHLAFGLRQVAGTLNNTVPGNSAFGAADRLFPRLGAPVFRAGQTVTVDLDGPGGQSVGDATSYTQTGGFVFDADPRMISNLIADQTANNPAARAAQNLSTPGTGYIYQGAALTTNPNFDPARPEGLDNLRFLPSNVNLPSPQDAHGNLFVANVTPDAGLSAPFNSWLTFFGQFFDHGLDLVTKGGNGFVYIPLQPDDPLIVLGPDGIVDGSALPDGSIAPNDRITDPSKQFMILTRATQFNGPGANGIFGDADDTTHEGQNTTTPFVDQNQTYSSHPSHQVFLREYARFDSNGAAAGGWVTVSTGRLLESTAADGSKHMATWADVKANALMLGIILNDTIDVVNVPLIKTDAYGNFIPDPVTGLAQLVIGTGGDGLFGTDDDVTTSGTVNADGSINAITTVGAARTNHAFLNDIGHTADPVNAQTGAFLTGVSDGIVNDTNGNGRIDPGETPLAPGTFDVDLLNRHYIAGDGRVNENIGLTAVHEIFHSEHNRQIGLIKDLVRAELANGDTAFATDWVLPGTNLADGIQDNEWNGQRLFQAAKFATETQYQHIVFEEFARKIAPTIHVFGNNNIHLDPAITAEFAHAVYRFGHSMLDETVNRYVLQPAFLDAAGNPTATDTGVHNPLAGTPMLDANGQPVLNEIGLISAFLNPLEYAAHGADAAGEIILGSVNQMGNEIDEFVTGALRNNLVGLPIDLAALNIARGRDTGIPPLNLLRNQLFDGTHDTVLKPYASWYEFGQFLKHPESLVNFIAAYGTHGSLLVATTLAEKRAAAQALVDGSSVVGSDAYNFLRSLDSFANDPTHTDPRAVNAQWSTGSVTGLDKVDLWIGGLAEKQNLFGGLLGSTFNFIFETQMEALQDGDRLYYLPRIEGIEFGTQIENNSFAELIMLNTGVKHLPASVFLTPEYVVEASNYWMKNADGTFAHDLAGNRIATDPSTWQHNSLTGAPLVEVLADGTVHFIGDDNFFGNTMVLGGTEEADRLIAGHADDDTVWGDGGDDYIDGGNGNDFLYGGAGNDTIRDASGDDVIHGDDGNDDIDGGSGDDLIFGNAGDDLIHAGNSVLGDEVQGGAGNDVIFGDEGDDTLIGNEGDDWISGGAGGDGLIGDLGAPTGQVPLYAGNDVLDGGDEGDKMTGFSGDDIMLGLGGFDKFVGKLGFDWASFEQETHGVSVDMERREFIPDQNLLAGDAVRDFFIETEAVSGSAFGDVLRGTNDTVRIDPVTGARVGGAASIFNELQNVDLIFGLSGFFAPGPVNFTTGNIMLGGDGSDFIEGRQGDDIIDGDAWLHVSWSRDANGNTQIFRDIFFDLTDGDIDTAVYNDVAANYIISAVPDAQGFYTVTHATVTPGIAGLANEGIDRIRNIERLQFADATFTLNQLLGLPPGPNENAVPTGTLTLATPTDNPATPIVEVVVGTPITATDTVTDADGIAPGSVHYQWQQQVIAANGGLSWVNISGTDSLTFTPTNAQLGNALRIVKTFVDGLGHQEQAFSLPTALLLPNLAVNTPPFISPQQNPPGLPDTTARQGNPLNVFLPITSTFGDHETAVGALIYTATLGNGQVLDGSAAAGGLRFVLQGAPGAVTGAFLIYDPDGDGVADPLVAPVGPITIRVTATDTGPGTPLSVTDTFVVNVQAGNTAPLTQPDRAVAGTEDGPPITGSLGPATLAMDPGAVQAPVFRLVANSAVGGTVTAFNQTTGAFTFVPTANLATLDANGAPIPGAAASFQYRLFDGQLSSGVTTVNFQIAATDDGPAPFSITGTAAVGQILSGLIGLDPDGPWDPTTATYEWFRNNVSLGAPTNSPDYTVTADDVGAILSVRAIYNDGQQFQTTVTSTLANPIGLLAVRAPNAPTNIATVTVLNTLHDPDGDPDPANVFYDWETSTDGVTWGPANPAQVSADGLTLSQANGTVRFVRTTTTFIDAAGNLNTATSEAVRVVVGTGANNALNGLAGTDILFGLAGQDTINAGDGADTLIGGAGPDILNGGAGNDTFIYDIGDGADTVSGGAGTDTLVVTGTAIANTVAITTSGGAVTTFQNGTLTGVEAITLDLLGGVDTLDYSSNTAANGVTVNLATGLATGFTSVVNVENVDGGAGADTLTGDNGANVLNGNGGADTLSGGAGADTLNGGVGNDILSGGAGNDTLVGGVGADTASFSGSAAAYGFTLNAGGSITVADGRAGAPDGSDTLATVETFDFAGALFTLLAGTNANNTGGGALNGGLGADLILGFNGADALNGNGGNDILVGGAGNDTMNGGAGDDMFLFSAGFGADTINGFDANPAGGQDVIALAASYGITAANFAARVVITDLGADTRVTIDGVDSMLLVGVSGDGANVITQSDFIFGGP